MHTNNTVLEIISSYIDNVSDINFLFTPTVLQMALNARFTHTYQRFERHETLQSVS